MFKTKYKKILERCEEQVEIIANLRSVINDHEVYESSGSYNISRWIERTNRIQLEYDNYIKDWKKERNELIEERDRLIQENYELRKYSRGND